MWLLCFFLTLLGWCGGSTSSSSSDKMDIEAKKNPHEGRDEASIGTYLCERVLILNEEATRWGTKIEMFSYLIFIYIVIRIGAVLLLTHLADIVEAMLLNPGTQSDVIPRFGYAAMVLEVILCVITLI